MKSKRSKKSDYSLLSVITTFYIAERLISWQLKKIIESLRDF